VPGKVPYGFAGDTFTASSVTAARTADIVDPKQTQVIIGSVCGDILTIS
jgi:hypothetical protein